MNTVDEGCVLVIFEGIIRVINSVQPHEPG